jgi:Protein of unknown function (DUF3667)
MPEGNCTNCAEPLAGPYCHVCGQEAFAPDRLSARSLARELRAELSAFDFTTVRSLRGLARPGFLTREYLAGRQQPYLSPVKLYLLCAAIFFLMAPLAGLTLDDLTRQDTTGLFERLTVSRMQARGIDRALFAERFDLRLQTVYTFGLSVSLAGAALLLGLLFRRQKSPFGAHVVFALHYVAFLYLAAILVGVVTRVLAMPPLVNLALGYGVAGPYLVLALRRVYGEPLLRTLLKAVVILLLTAVLDSVVNVAAFLLAIVLV